MRAPEKKLIFDYVRANLHLVVDKKLSVEGFARGLVDALEEYEGMLQ